MIDFKSYAEHCPIKIIRLFIAKLKNVSVNEVMFGIDRLQFSSEEIFQLESFISRYKIGEPISKILNKREFWNSEFFVNKDVLDPRPETEIIIEQTLRLFKRNQSFDFKGRSSDPERWKHHKQRNTSSIERIL